MNAWVATRNILDFGESSVNNHGCSRQQLRHCVPQSLFSAPQNIKGIVLLGYINDKEGTARRSTCTIAEIPRLHFAPTTTIHEIYQNRNHEHRKYGLKSGSYIESQVPTGLFKP